MCGILGFHGFERPLVRDALAQIVHRGPDDDGVYADGPVCLGMRRLSIIDVAGSQQPIFNEDRSLVIVFNGEIYNYQELQRSLAAKGHSFRTQGDTEMIVHLYEEYGPACVHLLRGMFAFAIWNTRDQSLFLARDRLGIKPLYYHWDGRRLAFASEIKALRVVPGLGRALDPAALDGYLAYRYVPGPRTMYRDIVKLQAGHTLSLRDGELSVARYWAPTLGNAYVELTRDEAAHELYRLLDEAVRLHLIADVPLGLLLSSGVDSAALLGLMSRHSTRPVQTFTVGFHDTRARDRVDYDETAAARAIAAHFGADHQEVRVSGSSAAALLPRLMWHFDEPVADPAALPTFQISQFARQSVTVALSGEGADELLGGYPRYYWSMCAQRLQRLLPASLARGLVAAQAAVVRSPARRQQARLLLEPMDPAARHVAWTRGAVAGQREALLRVPATEPLAYQALLGAGASIHDLMRADLQAWLVDEILMKADKMSMATSLELRVPFLDHHIVEFATALPDALKLPFPETKPLLRRAMRPLLPASALGMRKRAFSVPIAEWMRRAGLREVAAGRLLDPAHEHGLFDRAAVRRLWEEHQAGGQNHAVVLWTLFCFETWYDEVFLRPERTDFVQQPAGAPTLLAGAAT